MSDSVSSNDRIRLEQGYRPGAIADVVGAHIAYYAPAWGFGLQFESKVATELCAFLQRYDPARDLFLSAIGPDDTFLGSITIDGAKANQAEGAHLRWFILADAARGAGLGKRLVADAINFCDARQYGKIYLTTFAGLDAARHLYEQAGFRLTSETNADTWSGGNVGEQRFERIRPGADQ
ncbi:MAG: GNAT superfamily N-acetyltransferase [Hyphomicrobiaceae bacterium]|jgi:GNAT superfamily N-acetyltransferase